MIKVGKTLRGFTKIEFVDANGEACSIQASSEAVDSRDYLEPALWFGRHLRPGARMHLTQSQVAELLPSLIRFVKTGELV